MELVNAKPVREQVNVLLVRAMAILSKNVLTVTVQANAKDARARVTLSVVHAMGQGITLPGCQKAQCV